MATLDNKLHFVAQAAINARLFPGCLIGIIGKNIPRTIITAGNFTYEPNSPKITANSIFDIASLTKVLPTSILALILINQKNLSLQQKIIDYLPEIRSLHRREITLWHLLTQTLEFDLILSDLKNLAPNDLLTKIFQAELKNPPGTNLSYCNLTSILLGIFIERSTNQKLPNLSQKLLFDPLEMPSTSFNPLRKFSPQQIVPTEIDPWRQREIRGKIHDESAYVLNQLITPGSAGLFSNGADLINLLTMLVNQGSFRNRQIIANSVFPEIIQNQIPDLNNSTALGFELNQTQWIGNHCSQQTIGKTGFTGCSFLIDYEKHLGLLILSNHTYPKRRPNKDAINGFRRQIADIVLQ